MSKSYHDYPLSHIHIMAELSQKCDFSSAVRARGGVSVQVDTYLVGYLTCTYLEALILSSAESTSQASKPNPVCQQQGYTKMLHPPRPAQPPQPSRPSPGQPCPALPCPGQPCPALPVSQNQMNARGAPAIKPSIPSLCPFTHSAYGGALGNTDTTTT